MSTQSEGTLRHKIQTWVALSHDRDQTVLDVLQEIIQELLQSDNYMQQQMAVIAVCTTDDRLKNALVCQCGGVLSTTSTQSTTACLPFCQLLKENLMWWLNPSTK